MISNKSSRTFFNTNTIDRLILNSTKEEENASLNNRLNEDYKIKINNKIQFLEIQLKNKSEKIKMLQKQLENGHEHTKSIQKSNFNLCL